MHFLYRLLIKQYIYLKENGLIIGQEKDVQGNQEIPAEYPENKGGPLFVRAGAIIPTQVVKE